MPRVARHGDHTACRASLISGASRTYVNGPRVIRLGDTADHGGVVITASETTFYAEGPPVARIGDLFNCAIHGINPIVEGSPDTFDGD